MLGSFATKATVTKIRAKNGKMLTENNYRELLNKQSVSEVAEYLRKNTRYRPILLSIDTNTIHRGHLEELIRRCNFETYVQLCKFQQLDKISFYNYEVIKEEIDQILSCILHLNAQKSEDYILSLPSYLIEHSSYDMLGLAKVKSFNDLLKVVKNTSYWKVLKDVKSGENGQIDYLRCEVLLRTYFYKTMFEIIDEEFSGEVANKLKQNVKIQIDLINFINSYRLKVYFNADSEEIIRDMLPFYGRISKNKMYKFFEAKDSDQMLELFGKTSYARQIDKIDPDIVEKNIYQIRYKYAKNYLTSAQSAPVALYNFMYLCDVEAMNLISIVEGIRYNVSPAYIEKLLII